MQNVDFLRYASGLFSDDCVYRNIVRANAAVFTAKKIAQTLKEFQKCNKRAAPNLSQ